MAESAFSSLVWGRPVNASSIGGIKDLRNLDLNIFYIIKEKILPIEGYVSRNTETITPSSQEIDPITGLLVTPYKASIYDWVYYNPDPSNPALSGLLTAPIISDTTDLAYVDYANGWVCYSGLKQSTLSVTYDYYSVYVTDGYPDWGEDIKKWEDMRLPMVAIDHSARTNLPFAIGGRYQEDRDFILDIVANSDTQRDDITDLLETALRYDYTNSIDYRYGFPLLANGDKNPSFDRGPATRWRRFRFTTDDSRVVRSPIANDKFRHRSIINLSVTIN